ncbi:MAG: PadR family transcriptional regulator [Acidimicrobiales bacterium]
MLELAILGLLKEQDLHGYELKKRLTDALGPFSSVSFGSLYPALARLEAAGAVRAVETSQRPGALRPEELGRGDPGAPAVPMTGSMAGEAAAFKARRGTGRSATRSSRTRKVYGITDTGQSLFEDLLERSAGADDDRSFNFRLAFCRFLPPDRRLGLLERRRAQLVERLARSRSTARERRGRLDAYTQSLIEHGTEATERDISWLDRLIAIERLAVERLATENHGGSK